MSDVVRMLRMPHWMVFFTLILASWAILYAISVPADLRASARVFGPDFLSSLCIVTPDAAGFFRVIAMWLIMSIGMMAPTAIHAFATYDDLGRVAPTRFWHLIAGFLAVWGGFSVLAAATQMVLFNAGLLSPFGELRSTQLSAILLIAAGAYQFTALKDACLSKCRSPMSFFMAHWEEGPWRNGLRLGLVCMGCCWALMLLALVGGAMNVAFMGLATIIMITEKLPATGRFVTRPLGVALIATGGALAVTSI